MFIPAASLNYIILLADFKRHRIKSLSVKLEAIASSDERLPLSGHPHEDCRATKEELLRSEGHLQLWDDCPLCARHGISCAVGSHPSTALGNVYSTPDFYHSPSIKLTHGFYLFYIYFLTAQTPTAVAPGNGGTV